MTYTAIIVRYKDHWQSCKRYYRRERSAYTFVVRYKDRCRLHNRKIGGKNMSIKKKLGMGVATATLGLSLVAGGTFAYFSDSEDTINSFASGTLDLNISPGEEESLAFNFNDLKPGDTKEAKIHLKNDGSLNIKEVILDTEIGGHEKLADQIRVTATARGSSNPIVNDEPLSNLVEIENKILAADLKPEEESVYDIKFKFNDTGEPQNELQGKTLHLDMIYNASQE